MERRPANLIGYINAGGRGTRLNELFTPNPETGIAKALLKLGSIGIRLVDHHIANLRHQGVESVVIAAGDQPDVYDYIRDTYHNDSEVYATRSSVQLGTGGDLVTYARKFKPDSPIVVQNVDTILDIDIGQFFYEFTLRQQLGAKACIALTLNQGVPNESAFSVGTDGRVIHSLEFDDDKIEVKPENLSYLGSSTGAVLVSPSFLSEQDWSPSSGQLSLYGQTLRQAQQSDGLYAYNNGHRFFQDVGTASTWLDAEVNVELLSLLHYNNG